MKKHIERYFSDNLNIALPKKTFKERHTFKDRLEESKKGNYSRISKSGKSKYKHLTNERIADIKVRNKCENANILLKPATNSGVKGDNTPLYLDPHVSFYETI